MSDTLPDYLREGLWIISIGQNPSPSSVTCGYPFANPRNRFWRALHGSTLVAKRYDPSISAMHAILQHEGIGFTDVVKRPTAGSADLRSADYRDGAPRLRAKLDYYRPKIAWFQGLVAYRFYLKYALNSTRVESTTIEWGMQPDRGDFCAHFVSPNPSPANAKYSLDDLIYWYDRLAAYRESPD